MRTTCRATTGLYGMVVLVTVIGAARAEDTKPSYPAMAPIEQYLEPSAAAEIEIARHSAPTSVSDDATVLVLTSHGYETAVTGKNGFTCLEWRSWVSWAPGSDDEQFWNPNFRVGICFNPAGVRSILPGYLERTRWVLAGASKAEMKERTRAQIAAKRFMMPEPGALGFMMGKEGSDGLGHGWLTPHVMMFVARTEGAQWGSNRHGSPIFAEQTEPEPTTIFDIAVPFFSDGTPKSPSGMTAH